MNDMRKLMETMDSLVEYPIQENTEYNSKYVNIEINWDGLANAVRADILSFKKQNNLHNVDEALKVADAIEEGNWGNVEDTISGLSSISDRYQIGRFIENHAGGYFWWGFRADINFK